MEAPEALREPITSQDWLYELKFDGYRCGAGIDPVGSTPRVELRTKSGAICTAWFPEVATALSQLRGGPHVIDGEVCVLRPDGTSDFNLLQERAGHRRNYPGASQVTFCAFDLLVVDGRRIIDLPLVERKALLHQLLKPVLPEDESKAGTILFVKDLPADAKLFQAMVAAGLKIEGVMAKRRASTYKPGVRSHDWLKIKRPGWQEGRRWKGNKS